MSPLCALRVFAGVVLALPAVAAGLDPSVSAGLAAGPLVPAADPNFRYGGRFDVGDDGSRVVIWEASTVAIDFDGDRANLRFDHVTGQVYFNASVDGAVTLLALHEGTPERALALAVPGGGRHHLVLFKRSEASAGTVRFAGVEIAPGARTYAPAIPAYTTRMEFIGDSITVGACDEDGPNDQWNDRKTHDAAFSWAAVTAGVFSADYRNISISGIGLAAGYTDIFMGQVWDKTYPSASSPRADLTRWTPDAVLVLLGDNDDSYPRSHSLPFPANFKEKYAALIQAIRSAYPKASIVLLNGGMWAGTHSKELGAAWNAAVAALESKDPGIFDYTFAHWTMNHPRVADHRIMADELAGWLKSRPFILTGRWPGT